MDRNRVLPSTYIYSYLLVLHVIVFGRVFINLYGWYERRICVCVVIRSVRSRARLPIPGRVPVESTYPPAVGRQRE